MLLDVGRIDHYEHRLKALHYKKKFNERMTDAKNKVEGESRVVELCGLCGKDLSLKSRTTRNCSK